MRTIKDTLGKLKLNPRQIYIILRNDNKQYHEIFNTISKDAENDDIRFCIIDTTGLEKPNLKKTPLYQRLMEEGVEGAPWDFIVRNYPNTEKDEDDIELSCWHIVPDKDITEQLIYVKRNQENKIWKAIADSISEKFENNTRDYSKLEAFRKMLETILHTRGLTIQEIDDEISKLECNFNEYNHKSGDEIQNLIKGFVGDNISTIDKFFNVNTSRDISDEYMRCFFETGGYIFKPNLKIIKKGPVFGGNVHDKYGLQVTTTSGRTEEVRFSSAVAFSMYIFYMINPYKKIKIDDFNPKSDPKTAKHNWETLLEIYATIGESLEYQQSIDRLRELYKDFFTESKRIWHNSHKDKEAFKELGAEAEPFRIHPTEDNIKKPERWLNLSEDYIDLEDDSFKQDYRTNRRIIENRKLYQTFENERSKNTL